MEEGQKPLLLLQLMFGEAAEGTQRAASSRLLAWAKAFEAWMAENEAQHTRSAVKQARYAWQKLLRNRNIMLPHQARDRLWELSW